MVLDVQSIARPESTAVSPGFQLILSIPPGASSHDFSVVRKCLGHVGLKNHGATCYM